MPILRVLRCLFLCDGWPHQASTPWRPLKPCILTQPACGLKELQEGCFAGPADVQSKGPPLRHILYKKHRGACQRPCKGKAYACVFACSHAVQ